MRETAGSVAAPAARCRKFRRALEDLTGVDADLTIHVRNIGPLAHQPTGFDKGALGIGRGNPMMRRERRKSIAGSM